jgi:hypothetical protein
MAGFPAVELQLDTPPKRGVEHVGLAAAAMQEPTASGNALP